MNGEDVLDQLYRLLGDAVLLPIPLGRKGPQFSGWQKRTFAESKGSPALIEAALRGGNIGVLLGPASGRLLALDLDNDALVAEWSARHAWLANTLRTRGKRGCQFWLRLEEGCEYPNGKAVYSLDENNEIIGELRLGGAGGAQSVIFGSHPDGMPYQIVVDKPPLVVSLTDLDELAPELRFTGEPKREVPTRGATTTKPLPPHRWVRVTRYLDECEPAISGQRGHDTTFRVLCQVINGFGLSREEALSAAEYYNQKCEPHWSEKDLEHKVNDALKADHERPRGHLLQEDEFGPVPPPEMLDKKIEKEQAEAGQAANGTRADTKAEPSKSEHTKKPQLILPGGEVPIIESATLLFKHLTKTHRYFARGRLVVEVVRNKEGNEVLSPLRAIAFRSRIEKDFRLLTWRSLRGERVLKPALP
jgi:hypothetical protein